MIQFLSWVATMFAFIIELSLSLVFKPVNFNHLSFPNFFGRFFTSLSISSGFSLLLSCSLSGSKRPRKRRGFITENWCQASHYTIMFFEINMFFTHCVFLRSISLSAVSSESILFVVFWCFLLIGIVQIRKLFRSDQWSVKNNQALSSLFIKYKLATKDNVRLR